ncbi:related to fusarubin cluster-monooxygenase [Ramularia collo-cygni]|uniref:Related to fusarubin cluster-monooxygenase n=1 Tax=Ramularia collo-cygni TaxID=112498 RepID=A0A2D3URX9_9PEZI|nr:related to fusarubin cluster-monooxygenase [Ramularia collo-cygni]CZT16375.1 related to fusarubin cluster-monooxygenase [Ramularia collo-cygni]
MSTPVLRSSPTGISALISGAGIGGLVAALELWRKGCNVRVFEKTAVSSTAGDVINIGQSALKFLDHWPEMKKRHDEIAYSPLFAGCTLAGERRLRPGEMARVNLAVKDPEKAKRITTWSAAMHSRPKFHALLLEQVRKCGIPIEFGREVVDYFEDEDSAVGGIVLKDGERCEANVVVAAEGWHGQSWRLVAGEPVPAKSSGLAIFRAAYPVELAVRDPVVAERFKLREGDRTTFELWTGEGRVFATFWRNHESMMWSVTRPDLDGTAVESWSNKIDVEEVLKFTSHVPGWAEVADRVIKETPGGELIDWKLMWRDPQHNWVSPRGFVVQLGDAAHTFLPSSGNGATQAIEDAVSLAACIAAAKNIPDATRVHNLLRFERVSFLQAMGVARSHTRIESGAKNLKEPPVPGSWLWEHDAEAYAEERFEEARLHLEDRTRPFLNTNRPTKGVEYIPWTIDGLIQGLEKGEPTILDGDWS